MSNDLATTDDDGFGVDEPNNSFIVGSMIKFNNDHAYIVDKTQELTAGTRLVALSVTTAWTHWQEGKPEHHVTQPGQGIHAVKTCRIRTKVSGKMASTAILPIRGATAATCG
jgi:hypothetical protein